jgi:pyridoxal phosphate enzyme (YggS family)
MADIAANVSRVQARIEAAAHHAGRDASEVTLVAVTKTRALEAVQAAYQAGVRHFGENRVEEGGPKLAAFNAWLSNLSNAAPATWHMIGHVQHRKAARALTFDLIHSVDSLRLAEQLERLAVTEGRTVSILLECNVSGEASKDGFALCGWQAQREARREFYQAVRGILVLPHLRLRGLMTMAPIVPDAEQARPVFARLRMVRDVLREEFPAVAWPHLSMGMTDDFEVAIEEGATLVRIGRAIFGERK